MKIFKQYIKELQEIPIDELTEHSKRSALEVLLKDIAVQQNPKIIIQHEPRRIENYGSPDFKIFTDVSIIGYLENKKIEADLNKTLRTKQIKKYKELSSNILLTNYIEFIWLKNGQIAGREALCYISDIENKKFKLDIDKVEKTRKIIQNFFSQAPIGITTVEELANALAVRSRNLRDFLHDELNNQKKFHTEGKLFALFNTFKTSIFNELTIKEFSDAFAQMLAYGLFFAKLNADTKKINLQNAKKFIPASFNLIKELVNFLDILEDRKEYQEILWIVEEVISIMNNLQLADIKKDLSFNKNKKQLSETDPYIYFYENFLAKYDSKLRKSKGVYYTPPEIVSFIIRAINDILKQKFEIKNGLANHKKVTVLDFATGTGTFFLQVIQQIFDEIPSQNKRNLITKEHILKNIYGFEYLIAPYTIAHLKISQFLKDDNYKMQDDERLNIFLTNTLDPIKTQMNLFLPAISEEGKQAQAVKEKPILIITGNPPYSAVSKNKGKWITNLINDYKYVDGKHFGEQKHWLNDDYVKFIRFAQDKMDRVEEGIVGIITNHSFLNNPTFRGMRQSLMKTFNQLYFIDLHGNSLKKEQTPEGKKDENVFDIKQGVAISIMIKKKGLKNAVYHTDFWGLRNEKYKQSLETNIDHKNLFTEIKPCSPYYMFYNTKNELLSKYNSFQSIKDIFSIYNTGVCSQRDIISMQKDKNKLNEVLEDFEKLEENKIREKHKLLKDGRDWKISLAKNNIIKLGIKEQYIKKIHYRPYDFRYTYYTNKSKGFIAYPRYNVFQHFLIDNIGLLINRTVKGIDFNHAFVTKHIPDLHLFESANASLYAIPLYLYTKETGLLTNGNGSNSITKTPNFTDKFQEFIREIYLQDIEPEEILSYIYAILQSPAFTEKYLEFLRIDFPKIPFTNDIKIFKKISKLGYDLIQKHLQNEIPKGKYYENIGTYEGEGSNKIEKFNFVEIKEKKGFGKLFINQNQYFNNVPKEVFNYYIGGYIVVQKLLKDKKNTILDLNGIEEIEDIVKILYFSIKQKIKISKQLQTWI